MLEIEKKYDKSYLDLINLQYRNVPGIKFNFVNCYVFLPAIQFRNSR